MRPIRRASTSAALPGRTSSSRRRRSWATASATHWRAPGQQPDLLQHHQQRHRQGADGGPRHQDRRRHGECGAPHSPASSASCAALADGHEAGAGVGRLGGRLDGLLGAARARHRDHERVGARRSRAARSPSRRGSGTGQSGAATAWSTSPAMPLPPMPSTSTLLIVAPRAARRRRRRGRPAAVGHLLGQAERRRRTCRACRRRRRACLHAHALERRPDAVGLGLGQQAGVLGVVDRLGLVDEHDRDALADR